MACIWFAALLFMQVHTLHDAFDCLAGTAEQTIEHRTAGPLQSITESVGIGRTMTLDNNTA